MKRFVLSSWLVPLLFLAFFLVLPIVYPKAYTMHVVSGGMILAIATIGLQILLGFGGLLSLGQAAFLGIGAYTSALLTTAGVPFLVAAFCGAFAAGLSALLLVPITRLRDIYLAVATLGFTIVVHLLILNEEWLTGGSFGLMGIPAPAIGPWSLEGEIPTYYVCLGFLVLTIIGAHRLLNGRFGRALQAISLNEDAARASGVNVTYYKSQAFIVAAVMTGFAGALFASHNQYLSPNDFTFWKSIEILVMLAVGGIGSIYGAVAGAMIMTILPEYLRALDEFRMVVFGAALIIFMGAGSHGIVGLVTSAYRKFVGYLRGRPGAPRAEIRP